MIVEYVRYQVTGDASEFEAAYARALAPLSESVHCQSWELSRCHEEPDHYILRIEWDSLDGPLGPSSLVVENVSRRGRLAIEHQRDQSV